MRLLYEDAFEDQFRKFDRSAFHLEVADVYHTAVESEPIRRFLAGEPDDFAWQEPWLRLIRDATGAGRSVRRLRVVTVPHVDYTRWLLSISDLNVDAGEQIRWLPRHLVNGLPITPDDFWIFDDERVVYTLSAPDGSFSGGAETVDPVIVQHCMRIRDGLWPAAIPHADYVKI